MTVCSGGCYVGDPALSVRPYQFAVCKLLMSNSEQAWMALPTLECSNRGSAVVCDQGNEIRLCLWDQGTTGSKQVTQAKKINVAINGFGRIGEQAPEPYSCIAYIVWQNYKEVDPGNAC